MNLLEDIRKTAAKDQLKKVEKRLGFPLSHKKAAEDALQLRNAGMSSKKVMRELLRRYPELAKQYSTTKSDNYDRETTRLKATQAERTAKTLGNAYLMSKW